MSIKSLIHYKDKQINRITPQSCCLLLDLAETKGTVAIAIPSANKLLFLASAERTEDSNLKDLVFHLKELLPFDPPDFADTRLLFYNAAFDMVPARWYEHDDRDHYLILQQKDPSTFPTNVNKISALDLYVLSAVPFTVKLAMDAFNSIFSLYHAAAVFLSRYLDEYASRKISAKKVYCHYFTSGIEILVPEDGKVRFYNQVPVADHAEAVFFILNTFHALELPGDSAIVLSGDVLPKSKITGLLKKALPAASVTLKPSDTAKAFGKSLKIDNAQAFEHIFQLMKCE